MRTLELWVRLQEGIEARVENGKLYLSVPADNTVALWALLEEIKTLAAGATQDVQPKAPVS